MKNSENKFMVVISNNGNHSGHNRTWTLVDTFDNIEAANEKVNEIEEDDDDVKHGLTLCKVVTDQDVEEMKDEHNVLINF